MAKPLIAVISDPFQTPVSPGDDVSNGETTKAVCRITIMLGAEKLKEFICDANDQAIAKTLTDNNYVNVGPRSGNEQKIRHKSDRIFAGCFIVAALIFVLVIGGCVAIVTNKPHESIDKYDAQASCKSMVKDRLKSPSTAKFNNESTTGSANSYITSGYVDSQNAFGATVRSSFRCNLTYTASDNMWRGQVDVE